MRKIYIILLVGLLLSLIGGCIDDKVKGNDAIFSIKKVDKQAPNTPITIIMTAIDPLELNKDSNIKINVSSTLDAPDTRVDLILPEGISLESENSTWNLNLIANNPVILSAKIKMIKKGEWEIKAIANKVIDKDNIWGDIDAIYAIQSDKVDANIKDAKRINK